MPLQYAEKINASRSGMVRVATASGRDEVVSEWSANCSGKGPALLLAEFSEPQ
jgi:hypothetical protein